MSHPAPDINEIMRRADPVPGDLDHNLLQLSAALADSTRRDAVPRRRPRRRWLWIPVGCIAALTAASGAAAATGAFDGLLTWHVKVESADGTVIDEDVTADVSVPVNFVTTDGRHLSCTYSVAYLKGDVSDLRSFLKHHDWTGFGQEAYDDYLAHPQYPESASFTSDDGVEHKYTPEEIRAQGPIFSMSVEDAFNRTIPAELQPSDFYLSGVNDCDLVIQQ